MSAPTKFSKFHPKKNMINFFLRTKKSVHHLQNGRFEDFETELLGIENFFFNEFNLVLHVFEVKFTGYYYAVGIIPNLKIKKTMKSWFFQ